MKKYGVVLMLLSVVAVMGCNKDDQREEDDRLIMEYIDENGLDAQSTGSGLYVVIDEPGNGEHPDITNRVRVKYRGTFLNGQEFDANDDIEFPLNQVIQGWQEGIPYYGKGGNGMLLIPSHLGYGSQSRPGIPGNSVLIFDVELIDFD